MAEVRLNEHVTYDLSVSDGTANVVSSVMGSYILVHFFHLPLAVLVCVMTVLGSAV